MMIQKNLGSYYAIFKFAHIIFFFFCMHCTIIQLPYFSLIVFYHWNFVLKPLFSTNKIKKALQKLLVSICLNYYRLTALIFIILYVASWQLKDNIHWLQIIAKIILLNLNLIFKIKTPFIFAARIVLQNIILSLEI